jgi:outer membrane protein TolC
MTALLVFNSAAVAGAQEVTYKLDLEDCLRLGLGNNLELRNAQEDTLLAMEQVVTARSTYEPYLALSAEHEDSEIAQSPFSAGESVEDTRINGRVFKTLPTGSIIGIGAGATRYNSDGSSIFPVTDPVEGDVGSSLYPYHTFAASLTLEQPLLKNFGGAQDRARVEGAQLNYEASRQSYALAKDQVAGSIIDGYWSAYSAAETYAVNRDALERARRLLEINREKYEDNLIDETEILAAEAALATREVDLLSTENLALRNQDVVKELIVVPREVWDATEIVFDDKQEISVDPAEVSFLEAYEVAMENRPDMAALRRTRESILRNIEVTRQEARPDLKFVGSLGRGDTGDGWNDSVGFDRAVWSVGLQLELPWFRQKEKSELRQAEIQLRQLDNQVDALERRIDRECRIAARELVTAIKRVAATKKARDLHARKLELEEKKMEQGRSSTRFVIEYQDDLAFAEMEHVLSRSTHQKALAGYLLVQGILLEDHGPRTTDHGRAETSTDGMRR